MPRDDGSVLVALNGAGKLLSFAGCNDTACEPAQPVLSAVTVREEPRHALMVEVDSLVNIHIERPAVS